MVTISDTAFLAQSRYILLESMMMWFAFMAVLSVLKMRRYRLVMYFYTRFYLRLYFLTSLWKTDEGITSKPLSFFLEL